MREVNFMYELIKRDGRAKRGRFHTVHGVIETPVFMNVGTIAAIKGAVSTADLEEIGTQVELSNTYHLHVRPGDQVVKKLGGLHKFMAWDKPILTDSGGFQRARPWSEIGFDGTDLGGGKIRTAWIPILSDGTKRVVFRPEQHKNGFSRVFFHMATRLLCGDRNADKRKRIEQKTRSAKKNARNQSPHLREQEVQQNNTPASENGKHTAAFFLSKNVDPERTRCGRYSDLRNGSVPVTVMTVATDFHRTSP